MHPDTICVTLCLVLTHPDPLRTASSKQPPPDGVGAISCAPVIIFLPWHPISPPRHPLACPQGELRPPGSAPHFSATLLKASGCFLRRSGGRSSSLSLFSSSSAQLWCPFPLCHGSCIPSRPSAHVLLWAMAQSPRAEQYISLFFVYSNTMYLTDQYFICCRFTQLLQVC